MSDDDTAARESFKAGLRAEWTLGTDWAEIAMRHIEAASRSIPAAAALLREAGWRVEEPVVIAEEKVSDETLANLLRVKGWTVEEPKCETCLGERRIMSLFGDGGDIVTEPCPTCNGAGATP